MESFFLEPASFFICFSWRFQKWISYIQSLRKTFCQRIILCLVLYVHQMTIQITRTVDYHTLYHEHASEYHTTLQKGSCCACLSAACYWYWWRQGTFLCSCRPCSAVVAIAVVVICACFLVAHYVSCDRTVVRLWRCSQKCRLGQDLWLEQNYQRVESNWNLVCEPSFHERPHSRALWLGHIVFYEQQLLGNLIAHCPITTWESTIRVFCECMIMMV